MATAGVMLFKGPQARRYSQKAVHTRLNTQKVVYGHRRSLVICIRAGGLLVYEGISHSGGDGLNRTFGWPIGRPGVRPDFRPFFRPKKGGG